MTSMPDSSDSLPIYDGLIAQHGDVLSEAHKAAEATQEQADQALDWSDLHRSSAEDVTN